jgi:GNAT superfamily N-acetyltransferase
MEKSKDIKLIRTDSKNQDFVELVRLLDAELAIRDGDDHSFYDQFNKLDHIKYAVILVHNGRPQGCGALKQFEPKVMEVKRMFTTKEGRNKGFASKILAELENWAREMNYEKCILETGIMQPEAINLYKKSAYQIINNYGQYAGVENSICFEKKLKE